MPDSTRAVLGRLIKKISETIALAIEIIKEFALKDRFPVAAGENNPDRVTTYSYGEKAKSIRKSIS